MTAKRFNPRLSWLLLFLTACGATCRFDPSPSCSYRDERAEVPADGGVRLPDEVTQLELGQGHGCVVIEGFDGQCWGDNGLAQLTPRVTAPAGEGIYFDDFRGEALITVGGFHGCGIGVSDDAIKCWGNNDNRQLGDGTTEQPTGLVEVLSELRPPVRETVDGIIVGFRTLEAGLLHTCATDTRDVVCWGDNEFGQLGHEGQGPERVEGLPSSDVAGGLPPGAPIVVQLAAGAAHTCALLRAGELGAIRDEVWCWGDDRFGALGDGEAGGFRREPAPVDLGAGSVRHLVAGAHTTCAIVEDGVSRLLRCWGRGASGELGTGGRDSSATPQSVSLPTPEAGEAEATTHLTLGGLVPVADDGGRLAPMEGRGFGCLQFGSQIGCWGDNRFSQLLSEDPAEEVLAPTFEDRPDLDFDELAAGGGFTCGLRGPELLCWGLNDAGQLGSEGPSREDPFPATALEL